ncbi:MAG TPA: hypothetical protein VFS12_11555 [Terriglobia bacterium]|nr:hypothetical protein [Terriglobia bacterium]
MSRTNRPTWADALQWSEIPGLVKLEFDFLVSDYSFHPAVEEDLGTIAYTASYRAANIAIEPVVDRKDVAVEVCLVRLDRGERPQAWKIDARGRLVMVRLFEACWHRKVPSPRVTPNGPLSPHEQLRALLRAEATTLKDHFVDILQDSDVLFVEMEEQRQQVQRARTRKDFFSSAEALFRHKQFAEFVTRFKNCPYELTLLWEKRLEYARKRAGIS